MSKKDYRAIAEALHRHWVKEARTPEEHAQDLTVRAIALSLAGVFADDNPRFDRDRFLTACKEGL